MAFTTVLTGTNVSVTCTTGLNTFTLSAADAGIVVGSDMVGTGLPTGCKVLTISGTSGTMTQNATTSGARNVIFSSKFGSVLTITASANGDYFTPQNIVTNGFGSLQGLRELFFVGGLKLQFVASVAGAVFDFLDWTIETGQNGWLQFDQTSLGEFRSGYLVNGTQFIKTAGFTYYYNNLNGNNPGGSGLFYGTSTGTMTGLFRMHNPRFIERAGSNAALNFSNGRSNLLIENMILDYQVDSAGANSGIGAAYGTLKNTYLVKTNGTFNSPNPPNYATIDGLFYVGNYQSTPQHKFGIPNGYTLEKYTPNVLAGQYLGGFSANTNEYYSNIDLSSANWGLTDLKTGYLSYSGWNNRYFSRKVDFQFKDTNNAALTNVTLYIKGTETDVLNAGQTGNYSANTNALLLGWTAPYFVYRLPEFIVDNILQIAQARKYGYIQQSTSYSLDKNTYSQPFFFLADASLNGISESTASGLNSKIFLDWTDKSVWVTTNATYDEINARIAWELAQTTGSKYTENRTISGKKLNLVSGWKINVMPSVTLSSGTNITYVYADTFDTINAVNIPALFDASGVIQATGVLISPNILGVQTNYTGVGVIEATYGNNTGIATVLTISGFANNSSVYVEDNAGEQKFFNADVTETVTVYIPPTAVGPWYYAVEKFGNQRQSDFFTFSGGQKAIIVKDLPDNKILLSQAQISALTTVDNGDEAYDAIALLRTQTPYISFGQIVSKDGSTLYGGNYSIVIKANAIKVAEVDYSTKLITLKSSLFEAGSVCTLIKVDPPKTVTANSTESITVNIEDANGDSTVTIDGVVGSLVDVWKCLNGTINADFATGTKIASNIGAGKFRFIGQSGYKLIFYDKNFLLARDCSMLKGTYALGWYVFDSPLGGLNQTQAAKFEHIYTTLDVVDENVVDIQNTVNGLSASTGITEAQVIAMGLAKEATSQTIKDKVLTLNNYSDTALIAKIDSIKTTVEDKTGYSLTTTQIEEIAVAVESHLLNDGDSQQLINAIVTAIGNSNVDETVLVAAIRADLERAGGKIDAIGTPLQASNYVAPDNSKITSIKTKVDALNNYNDTALLAKIDAIKSVVDSVKTTVENKTGYSLTTAQVEVIATAVETHLLDETDNKMLINAIVGAIGNANVNEVALIAAIRADLERTGGKIDTTATKVGELQNADFTDTNALIIDLGNPLQAEDYVAPDNTGINEIKVIAEAVKTKVDDLDNFDDSELMDKVNAINPKLAKLNEGLQLLSNFEPYDDELP